MSVRIRFPVIKFAGLLAVAALLVFGCQNPMNSEITRDEAQGTASRALDELTAKRQLLAYIDQYFASYYFLNPKSFNAIIKMQGQGNIDLPHYSTSEAIGYGMRLAVYGYYLSNATGRYSRALYYRQCFEYLKNTATSISKNFNGYVSNGVINYYTDKSKVAFPIPTGKERDYSIQMNWWVPERTKLNLMFIEGQQIAEAVTGNYSIGPAADGDFDVAYALILADSLKMFAGSSIEKNNRDLAIRYIRGIIEYYYAKHTIIRDGARIEISVPSTGIWSKTITRPSDWMAHHLRVFQKYFEKYGPSQNEKSIASDRLSKMYQGIISILTENKWKKGLYPDFIEFTGNDYRALPLFNSDGKTLNPKFVELGESIDPDRYHWNACRLPWRLAEDFYMRVPGITYAEYGTAQVSKFNRYIATTLHNSSFNYESWLKIKSCYNIEAGSPEAPRNPDLQVIGDKADYFSVAFAAPAAAATISGVAVSSPGSAAARRAYTEKTFNHLITQFIGHKAEDSGYFEDSINIFSMLIMTNNMYNPSTF